MENGDKSPFQSSAKIRRSPSKNVTLRKKQVTSNEPEPSALEIKIDKMMEMLSSFPELVTTVSKLVAELQSISIKLQSVENENNSLKKELSQMKKQYENNSVQSIEDICKEITERERRKKNIIFFNVSEPEVDGQSDATILSQFLSSKNVGSIKIQQSMRLGKNTSKKPRPLKVVCESQHDAFQLFSLRFNLPKNWRMSPDRTEAQREALFKVRSELENRKAQGEVDITIKFVNGVPTIIKSNTNSKNYA